MKNLSLFLWKKIAFERGGDLLYKIINSGNTEMIKLFHEELLKNCADYKKLYESEIEK